jgi:hypothetical protein
MKKVIALILMFTLVFVTLPLTYNSEVAFVKAEAATRILYQLGLFVGDEGGGFGLKNNSETSPFDDVSDWAQGYINRAYSQGLVSGIGNGNTGGRG